MTKLFSTFVFISFLSLNSSAQAPVKWYTFEEALEMMKVEKKKIVIDVYTDWCSWCKKMDKSTFQKTQIANYLNDNYYPVKLDAEQKEVINFAGQQFKYIDQGKTKSYHEFALAVTKGQLSYPTVVFIDENLNIIQSIPGFRNAQEFEMIMTYFGENMHKEVPWSAYQEGYVPMRIKFKNSLEHNTKPMLPAKFNDGGK
jgi:thioredoxin-related protein